MVGRQTGDGARLLWLTNIMLISLESIKQPAVLKLSFECYCLEFLDKKSLEDSSSGTAQCLSTYHYVNTVPITKSPRCSPSIFGYCKRSKTGQWQRLFFPANVPTSSTWTNLTRASRFFYHPRVSILFVYLTLQGEISQAHPLCIYSRGLGTKWRSHHSNTIRKLGGWGSLAGKLISSANRSSVAPEPQPNAIGASSFRNAKYVSSLL